LVLAIASSVSAVLIVLASTSTRRCMEYGRVTDANAVGNRPDANPPPYDKEREHKWSYGWGCCKSRQLKKAGASVSPVSKNVPAAFAEVAALARESAANTIYPSPGNCSCGQGSHICHCEARMAAPEARHYHHCEHHYHHHHHKHTHERAQTEGRWVLPGPPYAAAIRTGATAGEVSVVAYVNSTMNTSPVSQIVQLCPQNRDSAPLVLQEYTGRENKS
jgi:hypothetical protein